jgi:tetratricopeptide (TPR) repeat protein
MLHLRAAEALEQEHYARVEALAQHLYLARAWDKAVPYLLQAADRARAVCAYRDALRCYEQAIEAIEHLTRDSDRADTTINPDMRWSLQLKQGEIYALLGDYATAVRAYQHVLHVTDTDSTGPNRSVARRSTRIQALNGLCFVHGLTNDYLRARELSREAMALAEESPRLQDRAATYYQAGSIEYHMNNFGEALTHLQRALELYETVDSQEGQARCLELLAWVRRRQEGVTDRVVESLQQALAMYRALGDEYRERYCLVSLANVYLLRGAFGEVLRSCDAVLPFFRASAARYTISECQYLRGVALFMIGRLPEALETISESLAIGQELGITAVVQVNQMYRGQVLRALGDYEAGRRDLEAACVSTDRLVRPRALCALAELWLERDDLRRAFQLIAEALVLVREVGSQPYLGVALRVLGQVRGADAAGCLPRSLEVTPDAETCFKASIQLLETAQYESELALAYVHYSLYLLNRQRADEASPLLTRAQALAGRCGMMSLLETIQQALQQTRIAADGPPAPGQVRVRLARQGTPRGRPLRPDEFADVFWTVESAEDLAARRQGGKVAERHARIRRLCAEAVAQGAEPTVGDLAAALGVAPRTVDRDIAALRAAGELVLTRGASA